MTTLYRRFILSCGGFFVLTLFVERSSVAASPATILAGIGIVLSTGIVAVLEKLDALVPPPNSSRYEEGAGETPKT